MSDRLFIYQPGTKTCIEITDETYVVTEHGMDACEMWDMLTGHHVVTPEGHGGLPINSERVRVALRLCTWCGEPLAQDESDKDRGRYESGPLCLACEGGDEVG